MDNNVTYAELMTYTINTGAGSGLLAAEYTKNEVALSSGGDFSFAGGGTVATTTWVAPQSGALDGQDTTTGYYLERYASTLYQEDASGDHYRHGSGVGGAWTLEMPGVVTFSEATLGDFSNDHTNATHLGTLEPYSQAGVSGLGYDGDLDCFDFTLLRPATIEALVDITDPVDSAAHFSISTGLNSNNFSIYGGEVNEGSTSLGTLDPGSYTILTANGFDYTWNVTITPPAAPSTPVYQFHQEGTGDILATLRLSSLPAGSAEVVSLTFTPAGEAIFGFGPAYSGTFDSETGLFIDDGLGGLHGTGENSGHFVASIGKTNDLPDSSIFGELPNGWFSLGAGDTPNGDYLLLFRNLVSSPSADVYGDWVLVPEPATLSLLALGGVALLRRRRQ